jgi:hypothetical protein
MFTWCSGTFGCTFHVAAAPALVQGVRFLWMIYSILLITLGGFTVRRTFFNAWLLLLDHACPLSMDDVRCTRGRYLSQVVFCQPTAPQVLQLIPCMKGGHLFVLSKASIFWTKQANVTLFQKAAYCLGPVSHIVNFWAEPVMFLLPFLCLGLDICAYGLDRVLFVTHVLRVGTSLLHSSYGHNWSVVMAGITSRSAARIQWFTGFKAVLNTIMVLIGYKRPPRFKVTPKSVAVGADRADKGKSGQDNAINDPVQPASTAQTQAAAAATVAAPQGHETRGHKPPEQREYKLHAALSRVTNLRRHVMPMDGTLDLWVLLAITALQVYALIWGIVRLYRQGSFSSWESIASVNVLWLGVVYALVDAVPGLLFLVYMVVWEGAPWFMSVWVPLVVSAAAVGAIAIELRLAIGYIFGN